VWRCLFGRKGEKKMNKISKMLRKLMFQRKRGVFHRKNGSSMQFRKKVIIFGGLCSSILFIGLEIKNYLRVLLSGKDTMQIFYNRYGEIYIDGILLFSVMVLCLFALFLYLKDVAREMNE